MPSICFLVSTTGVSRTDNHRRLPRAFAAAGWEVAVHDHAALRLAAGMVSVAPEGRALADFDLVWTLGFGARDSFFDRMQLLATLDQRRMVNSAPALLELHAKYRLAVAPFAAHHPETVASADAAWLRSIVETGGRWIAKPPAGSFGQNVFLLTADDPNLAVILEQLTGHDGSSYCILQRWIAEAAHGEKRVLLANGEPVGWYLRRASRDHRANLAVSGHAEPTELTAEERSLACEVGRTLVAHGVRFAAVDLAYPYIIEFNLANPGGLETLERLTGVDPAPRVVAALTPLVTVPLVTG